MAVTALICPSCGAPLQHGKGTCPYCGVAVQLDRPAGGPPMGAGPGGGHPGGPPTGPSVDLRFRPETVRDPHAVAQVVNDMLGIPMDHVVQILGSRPPILHMTPTQKAQALQQQLRTMGVEVDLLPPRPPGGPPPGGPPRGPGFGGPPRGPGFGGPPRGPFGPPGGRRR